MAGLVIRPRARILHGHDWVYASEVLKIFGQPADGDVISLKDGRDHLLGSAIYNSQSQIVARRFSRRRQDLDADFFRRRIAQAAALRERAGCRPDLCRLVWSEADGLPGVIVDRYGGVVVLQTLTAAMDQRKAMIVEVLAGWEGVETVIERNDAPVRKAEGLPEVSGVSHGPVPGPQEVEIQGVRFEVDLMAGQKTGFYLDQIGNYRAVAEHASGRKVLDCFANQGGFSLICGRQGAAQITAVESSRETAALLRANARRNELSVAVEEADVFDFLAAAGRREQSYDLLILDPPSFTRARGKINDALRGYRDLHLRAAKLLQPGALLATFSCSHHVSAEEFEGAVAAGLADARRSARVIARLFQAADHPVLLHLPETAYLKGLLLELVPGR